MQFEALRRAAHPKPFRPIRLTLRDGTRISLRQPYSILVSRVLCVAVKGRMPVLFDHGDVVAAEPLRTSHPHRKRA